MSDSRIGKGWRQRRIAWINEGKGNIFLSRVQFLKHLESLKTVLLAALYSTLCCDFTFGNKTFRRKNENRPKTVSKVFMLSHRKKGRYTVFSCIKHSHGIFHCANRNMVENDLFRLWQATLCLFQCWSDFKWTWFENKEASLCNYLSCHVTFYLHFEKAD